MAEITWSKLALDDLDSIHDYIAKESPFYAQKTIEEFIERVSVLATHPEIGREVPEYVRKDVRELNEGNYRIFYKINKNNISQFGEVGAGIGISESAYTILKKSA
jgi:addiction module RelE/StbE family toxin